METQGKKEKKEIQCMFRIMEKDPQETEVILAHLVCPDLEDRQVQQAHLDTQANQACPVFQVTLVCQVNREIQVLEWMDKRGSRVMLDFPGHLGHHC